MGVLPASALRLPHLNWAVAAALLELVQFSPFFVEETANSQGLKQQSKIAS